jgi:hypothetical protein
MASCHPPRDGNQTIDGLAETLHGRSRWRVPVLLLGSLFAGGRRVVAAWIRAAGLSHDFQNGDFLLQSVGRRWREVGMRLLA